MFSGETTSKHFPTKGLVAICFLSVFQEYKEPNSFPILYTNRQKNYYMFPFCLPRKWSTCFPILFSQKTVTIPSSVWIFDHIWEDSAVALHELHVRVSRRGDSEYFIIGLWWVGRQWKKISSSTSDRSRRAGDRMMLWSLIIFRIIWRFVFIVFMRFLRRWILLRLPGAHLTALWVIQWLQGLLIPKERHCFIKEQKILGSTTSLKYCMEGRQWVLSRISTGYVRNFSRHTSGRQACSRYNTRSPMVYVSLLQMDLKEDSYRF